MKRTVRKIGWRMVVGGMLLITLISCIFAPLGKSTTARAENTDSEIYYCEDNLYQPENGIELYGEGTSVNDSQVIYWDDRQIIDDHIVYTAPSFGNTDNTMDNLCAAMAGTNAMGYYDRWYTNLIPNYTPGMMGTAYEYFPDMGMPATKNTIRSLYNLMETNVGTPGTSQNGFKSGLTSYVNQRGYNISYSSFHKNSDTVNLRVLANAIEKNKVGVLFCSAYNFIYCIDDLSGRTEISKRNSNIGHMMMVYGYKVVAYYKNGVNFQTDTYLQVASGYSTSILGYIRMNDYIDLDDALILNLS